MRKYFLILATACFSITAFAQTQYKMKVNLKSGEKIAFLSDDVDSLTFDTYDKVKVNLSERFVTSNTVAVNIESQENVSHFYALCVPAATQISEEQLVDYIIKNKTVDKSFSYKKSFDGLEADKEYNVYALAFDKNEIPGEVSKITLKTGKSADDKLKIEVLGTTTTSVSFKVTPADNNMKYYSLCSSVEKYYQDCDAEDNAGDVFMHFVAYWKFLASMYSGYTWQDMMEISLVSGEKEEVQNRLKWDTDHMIVSLGVNKEGELITPIYTKSAKTLAPKPSTNQISLELKDIVTGSVKVKVTTSNDEQYYLGVQQAAYVDSFSTLEEMADNLCYELDVANFTHNGNEESVELKPGKAGRDYYVIAIPLDNGAPSGKPVVQKFTNPK